VRLETHFRDALAGLLLVGPSEIDPQQPLNTLGLSSLATMELKNAVEESFAVALPVTSFLQGASVAQLASEIVRELSAPPPLPGSEEVSRLLWQLQRLSDDEVKTLLAGDDVQARSVLA
jgi:acyl carrier protein